MKKHFAATLLILSSTTALAAKNEEMFQLAASGGIASPSVTTSVFQNPAGLAYTSRLNVDAYGGWDSSFNNPTYRGGLAYGNGNFGLTGGVNILPSASASLAYFGLGFYLAGIHTAFGASGTLGLSPASGTSINVGAMIFPSDKFHLGFTALGINNSIQELGAGIGIALNSNFEFVFDASANSSLGNLNLKPGILITDRNVGVTASYGIGNGSTQLINGFNAGAFISLNNQIKWEVYYNQITTIFTAFSIRI